MEQITKKQHYVQRAYLRSWAKNEKIWAYRKQASKIYPSDLMGVGQERYFYELEDLSDQEMDFLKKYIELKVPSDLQGINSDFHLMFNSHVEIRKKMEHKNLPENEISFLESEIEIIKKMNMEKAHGIMENLGSSLLNAREKKDFNFLNESEKLFEAMMYICFQYFRTRKMKNIMIKSFASEDHSITSKVWPQMSFILSTILAKSLSLDEKIKIYFLNNPSDVDFITGDQPIFNLVGDDLDSEGFAKNLELYYPLSPKVAMLIQFSNEPKEKIIYKNLITSEIQFYNSKLFEIAEDFIYSNSEDNLNAIKMGSQLNS